MYIVHNKNVHKISQIRNQLSPLYLYATKYQKWLGVICKHITTKEMYIKTNIVPFALPKFVAASIMDQSNINIQTLSQQGFLTRLSQIIFKWTLAAEIIVQLPPWLFPHKKVWEIGVSSFFTLKLDETGTFKLLIRTCRIFHANLIRFRN